MSAEGLAAVCIEPRTPDGFSLRASTVALFWVSLVAPLLPGMSLVPLLVVIVGSEDSPEEF